MKKIVAGLTGGIASGKSAAAEMFEQAGAYIIDTDVVARKVADMPQTLNALRAAFPAAFDGDALNRSRLRAEVFADGGKLSALNSIMHPLIKSETLRQIAAADFPVVIVVVPLLFEARFDDITSPNITVQCPERIRIERLVKRDTISEKTAQSMIAAQMTDEERAEKADTVIFNDGSLARLRAQVLRVYCELAEAAREVKEV